MALRLELVSQTSIPLEVEGILPEMVEGKSAGEIEQLFAYCEQDVDVTRRLYEFGKQNRYVQFYDKRYKLQRVAVSW